MGLQDAADVELLWRWKVSDHDNEQLNLREVGKLLHGKENKGELFMFKFQLMNLTQNAMVLHTTHQPAKPVETINTSHVFAAEKIKTKLLNKNSPLNVEAAKNKANVKTKFIWFWSSKTTCLSIFKWTVNWVAKYFDTSKSPKFPHF